MTHKGTAILETPRLILRRFVSDDAAPMFENCWSDPEVWKWTNYALMRCMADVRDKAQMFTDAWLGAYARPNRYSWAIELRATGEVIGRMFGMHPDDRLHQVELAYELGRAWWNQGLMTEAVQAVIAFFFEEVGMNRIHAYHADANPASGCVMRKAGMRYEATLRQACICNAGVFDQVYYSILAEEYFSRGHKKVK